MARLLPKIEPHKTILFVGSGISKDLGLPNWEELIGNMGQDVGYDKDIFSALGSFLTLAEYYSIERGGIGPLRSMMDTAWHSPNINIGESDIHKSIVYCKFPIIYTTNYDRWIEKAFEHYDAPHVKIKNIGDLCHTNEGGTQIIKFHGDFDDDSSLVLTESSYFERLEFESALDIKLRADVQSKSVLFIGYSFSDLNVRFLFYKLWKIWANYKMEENRPPSYIYLDRPNPVQERVLRKWGIRPIVDDGITGGGLARFMARMIPGA